ncbi:hypothetical protein RND81_02G081000 [Saponaria officinalis]|uniref:Uncharacterized protein n=1 Tax=Saponaria officinalis TaxID=3572 RepID=A0AAW1MTT2_SAPOF
MEDDEEIQSHASHNTEEEDDDDEVVVDELKQRGDRIGNEILENSRRSLEIFIEFRLKLCPESSVEELADFICAALLARTLDSYDPELVKPKLYGEYGKQKKRKMLR